MTDLAKAFVDAVSVMKPGEALTWDQFFDAHGVPADARTDFAIAAIYKQAMEKYGWKPGGSNDQNKPEAGQEHTLRDTEA